MIPETGCPMGRDSCTANLHEHRARASAIPNATAVEFTCPDGATFRVPLSEKGCRSLLKDFCDYCGASWMQHAPKDPSANPASGPTEWICADGHVAKRRYIDPDETARRR